MFSLIINPYLFPAMFVTLLTSTDNFTNKPPSKRGVDSTTATQVQPGTTPVTRFPLPAGFQRFNYPLQSFAYYLSHFPLKPAGSKVYLYNGNLKQNQAVSAAVLDISTGTKDLQQCADAVIRLRAEYLFKEKEYASIHFNFTNGFRADYSKWQKGYRVKITGNNVSWYKPARVEDGNKAFRDYLELVFSYAGTLSLGKELKKIQPDSMQVGDVFIHGGSPGHAIIVMDMAVNPSTHEKIFMVAQSYMPAQDIHILVNSYNKINSPWYNLREMEKMYSPEWSFEKDELKRF